MRLWGLALLVLGVMSTASAEPLWSDSQGNQVTLSSMAQETPSGLVMLVAWCSYCGSCRSVEHDLQALASEYRDRVSVAALSAHPADGPARVNEFLQSNGLDFRVLFDPVGGLVDTLGVERTTTALIYDKSGRLRYFGPLESGTSKFAEDALESLLAGRSVTVPHRPQQGCPIPRP